MPKKRDQKKPKKVIQRDVTISDSADAPKPVGRLKKSTPATTKAVATELTWDQIHDDDLIVTEEVDEDGNTTFVYNKKHSHSKSEEDNQTGVVYPEIVWYLISPFIKPEDVGRFAGINRATYAVTKRESFWRGLYKNYCEGHPKLPEKLRLENSYKVYGIRQRVIRALYHTYIVFEDKIAEQAMHDSKPHELVKRRCVNVWFYKGTAYWFIYFKLKRLDMNQQVRGHGILEELSRVEANPEDNSQILLVTCQTFSEVPPLMGMTLTSISILLSQGFRYHRMHLGFNTGVHFSKDILPEYMVVIDTVVSIIIYDWWHPKYPHFDNTLPSRVTDEETLPVLKKDFFT